MERKKNSRDAMHRRSYFSCATSNSATSNSVAFGRLRRSVRSRLFSQFALFSQLAAHNSQLATRRAVTLIELLIVMAIIATLSTAFLGASRSAMETARAAQTKTLIAKINGLLMERWASYATRRVDIDPALEARALGFSSRDSGLTDQSSGQAFQDIRLLATRELIKMEMPDRWSDIVLSAVPDDNPSSVPLLAPAMLASRSSLSSTYWRRYRQIAENAEQRISKPESDGALTRRNQGAECLYMIVMLATGDGEARSLFRQQNIGDTDGDGAPEFIDGWGNPIRFIRWPAGFAPSQIMTPDADADHDAFDPFRRDMANSVGPSADDYEDGLRGRLKNFLPSLRDDNDYGLSPLGVPMLGGFRLVPLIYSYGSDGKPGILVDTGTVTGLDPYAAKYRSNDGGLFQLATPKKDSDDDGPAHLDNIHNHLLDGR